MMDDLSKWLLAMLNSGSVTSFISVNIPTGKLKSGWIGQSLVQKGFSGKIEDKKNQEQLVIPLDRFVRLITEWIGSNSPQVGLLLLGQRGLTQPRFIAIVSNDDKKGTQSQAIAFNSESLELDETIHQIALSISGKKNPHISREPNLDYIEELRDQTSSGSVSHLLALRLPNSVNKIIKLIESTPKGSADPSSIIFEYGEPSDFLTLAPLVTKWLLGLNLFQKTSNSVAALFFIMKSNIWVCLWDSPQRTASFAMINATNIDDILMRYVYALWVAADDLSSTSSKSPNVTVRADRKRTSTSAASDHSKKSQRSPRGPELVEILDDLNRRVAQAENQMRVIEESVNGSGNNNSLTVVTSKLTETIDRLESLAKKLDTLEKRIDKISNDRK